MRTGYFAPEGFEHLLEKELKGVIARQGRLFLTETLPQKTHWAQNIWFDPVEIPIHSISDGAAKLKALQRLWAFYPLNSARRGSLIAEKLPYFSPKPLCFPSPLPKAPLGSWMLLDDETILASPTCSSPFAHGEVLFQESKEPPSRAYLKLLEALTLLGQTPQKGDRCLDLGASPGSWSWVLDRLGAEIIAIDRSPLSPELSHIPFIKHDAFSYEIPYDVKWIFCDVACYPEKLLEWIHRQLERGIKARFVCTLKFQGDWTEGISHEFEKIPGSRIVRLFHNKHELTWIF